MGESSVGASLSVLSLLRLVRVVEAREVVCHPQLCFDAVVDQELLVSSLLFFGCPLSELRRVALEFAMFPQQSLENLRQSTKWMAYSCGRQEVHTMSLPLEAQLNYISAQHVQARSAGD
jgi:hypothetical protein